MEPINDRRRFFLKDVPSFGDMPFAPALGRFASGTTGAVVFALLQVALFVHLLDDITVTEFANGVNGEMVKSSTVELDQATWRSYATIGGVVALGVISLFMKFYGDVAANWGARILIGLIPAALSIYILAGIYTN